MREIASFEDERTAKLFADVLCVREIETEISRGKTGRYSVWVLEEKHVEPARTAWAAFDSDPESPEHAAAAGAVERKHKNEEKLARVSRHEIIDLRGTLAGPSRPVRTTVVLVAASVAVALATRLGTKQEFVLPLLIADGYEPSPFYQALHGQPWRFFTPVLLHFEVTHILFNMWWLVDLGSSIERRIGAYRMAGLVLVTGVFSNAAQYWMESHALFGGMSGVVYALLGYAFVRSKTDSTFDLQVPPAAAIVLVVWLVVGFTGHLGPVANYAHLGGLVAGLALGVRFRR